MTSEEGKEPEKELVLEGVLNAILKVEPNWEKSTTMRGGEVLGITRIMKGYLTTFNVRKSDDNLEEYTYNGPIYPDSLGNRVQVFRAETDEGSGFKTRRKQVFDTELNRWYS